MKIESDIHGNKSLWRYIDLEKFLDLIINGRLYLSKASILSDQYETSLPIDNEGKLEKYLKEKYPNEHIRNGKIHSIKSQVGRIRESTYISSWSIDTEESYALWKIYLAENKIGVAIKTTASKLRNSIKSCEFDFINNLHLRSVNYSFYRKFEELFNKEVSINKHFGIATKKWTIS